MNVLVGRSNCRYKLFMKAEEVVQDWNRTCDCLTDHVSVLLSTQPYRSPPTTRMTMISKMISDGTTNIASTPSVSRDGRSTRERHRGRVPLPPSSGAMTSSRRPAAAPTTEMTSPAPETTSRSTTGRLAPGRMTSRRRVAMETWSARRASVATSVNRTSRRKRMTSLLLQVITTSGCFRRLLLFQEPQMK